MQTNKNEKIERLLNANRVSEALELLHQTIAETGSWQYSSELDEIASTYHYLMHYMLEGVEDSNRERFYQDIVAKLHQLNAATLRAVKLKADPNVYYSTARTLSVRDKKIVPLLDELKGLAASIDLAHQAEAECDDLQRRFEQALADLFNLVWTSFPISKKDMSMLVETASDENINFAIRCQIISALLLGLTSYFEAARFDALIDIYEQSTDISVRARAMTALMLAACLRNPNFASDQALNDRLSAFAADDDNYARLKTVLLEFVKTIDTERINRKLREEVIPKIRDIQPEIMERFRDSGAGTADLGMEINPEWEEIISRSGLDAQLRQLTEMQSEGADVMMLPFANLKRFPFFNDVANWFLPFDPNHTSVKQSLEKDSPFFLILNTPGMMCDSDKYSLALSLTQIPKAQKEMMRTSIEGQQEMLDESMAEMQLMMSQTDVRFKQDVSKYLRDIYRFFKLFRLKQQFKGLFDGIYKITEMPVGLNRFVDDDALIRLLAEFYLKREIYDEALAMFGLIEAHGASEPSDYEKTGFCYQKLGDFAAAMPYYRKAQLFNASSRWLLKQMALVSRRTGQYADAIEFYTDIIADDPENVSLIMSLGACFLQLGQNEEALKQYFKANYLAPDNKNSLRAIAWTEFLLGHNDKSASHYEKLLADSPSGTDYLNAGHLKLVEGNVKQALELYQKSATAQGSSAKETLLAFKRDIPVLIKLGVPAITLTLLNDKLRTVIAGV